MSVDQRRLPQRDAGGEVSRRDAGGGVSRRDVGGRVALATVGVLAALLSVISVVWPTGAATPSKQRQPVGEQSRALSDLPFTAVSNGLGPVARDQANGGAAPDDGGPLVLGGVTRQRGIGVYAPSQVRLYPQGACDRLVVDAGVDASGAPRGSVTFQVVTDGAVIFDSGPVPADDEPRHLDLDIAGAAVIDLVVTDAGNGNAGDAADWADGALLCRS